jgi:hypothetical protein
LTYECIAPFLPAGKYPVYVMTSPYGVGLTSAYVIPMFQSSFTVNKWALNSIQSSVVGGRRIAIYGKGLSVSDTQVTICGIACSQVTANYSVLVCDTPAYMTISAVGALSSRLMKSDMIDIITVGKIIGSYSNSATLSASNDSDYTTYYSHYSSTCYIGLALPAGMRAKPYRVRYYPRLQSSSRIGNVLFEGSMNNGATYVTLGEVHAGVHEGWNFINAVGSVANNWFTHLRYRPNDGYDKTHCELAEIQFLGVVAYQSDTCVVNVTSQNLGLKYSVGLISYPSLDLTPIVNDITPNNGTALGGTLVKLSGSNLLPMVSSLSPAAVVRFSGIDCRITSHTDTAITCLTGSRQPEDIETMKVEVFVPGKGNALVDDGAEYLYIDRYV